jgi:hypothetical protein
MGRCMLERPREWRSLDCCRNRLGIERRIESKAGRAFNESQTRRERRTRQCHFSSNLRFNQSSTAFCSSAPALMAGEKVGVTTTGILAAAIAMEDQAGGGRPIGPCHVERAAGQLRRDRLTHGPAHDAPAEQVQHRGQVQPAFAGRDIGHVAGPDGVRPSHGEVAREQVRGDGQSMVAAQRCQAPSPLPPPSAQRLPDEPPPACTPTYTDDVSPSPSQSPLRDYNSSRGETFFGGKLTSWQ